VGSCSVGSAWYVGPERAAAPGKAVKAVNAANAYPCLRRYGSAPCESDVDTPITRGEPLRRRRDRRIDARGRGRYCPPTGFRVSVFG
jgi:hypothetical protein